jgi:hypothetical protein
MRRTTAGTKSTPSLTKSKIVNGEIQRGKRKGCGTFTSRAAEEDDADSFLLANYRAFFK